MAGLVVVVRCRLRVPTFDGGMVKRNRCGMPRRLSCGLAPSWSSTAGWIVATMTRLAFGMMSGSRVMRSMVYFPPPHDSR